MRKPLRRIGSNGKMREIRSDDKYDEKYAKQLRNGIRYKERLSVPQLCRKWRISRSTYNNWINKYEDFKDAAAIGQMDYDAYRWEIIDKLSTGELKGNAGAAIFGLENSNASEQYGKNVNINNNYEEQVQTINIKVLPRKENEALEHIIDVTPDSPDEQ